MRVYILSENVYYTKGMVRLMDQAGYKTHILRFEDEIDKEIFHHHSPCVIFVDAKRVNDCLACVMHAEIHCLRKIFCISDHSSNEELSKNNFVSMISRQTSIEKITASLNKLLEIPHHKVGCNELRLSPRELSVLYYYIKGESQQEISEKFNLSIKTISAHRTRALLKMGIKRISLQSINYVSGYLSAVVGMASV